VDELMAPLQTAPAARRIPRNVIAYDKGDTAVTYKDFARDCCRQLGQWGYSHETIAVYDRAFMQFFAYVKGHGATDDIRSFNDRLVYGFAESLGANGIHPNTIIKTLSALSTLARYGMQRRDDRDRRLVSEDPTKSFRWPQAQQQETKWVYPDEIRKLVDLEVPTYKAIARDVLIETGIRVGEACRLNVENFTESDGRYFLSLKLKGRGQQRRVVTRDVPLSKGLGDAIRNWLLLRTAPTAPDAPLLVNSEDGRWKRAVLSNMISRLADAAGITRLRVSAHKLRHSKNVRDRVAGIDAANRARLNGHSSLRSQERYDHVLPGELHEAADSSLDQLQRWIGGPFRAEPGSPVEDRNSSAENVKRDEG
jgi:site-specific recombinase XerD